EQRLVPHQDQVVPGADARQPAEVVQERGQVRAQPPAPGRRAENLAAAPCPPSRPPPGLAQRDEVRRDAEPGQVLPEQHRDVDAEGRMSFADEEQDAHATSRWTGWPGIAPRPRNWAAASTRSRRSRPTAAAARSTAGTGRGGR